jgi:pimeloyl-ACP methyl ester carboxylesterase
MRYFSGFALKNEEKFFESYRVESDFCVAGFSYGAQQAFEYVYNCTERVDRLILLSPAFFQNHKASFIKAQLRYFKLNQRSYTEQFLQNIVYPSTTIDLSAYLDDGNLESLEALLGYTWDRERMLELKERGVTIEVFIGELDKIVEGRESFEFFSDITTTYFLKGYGHLLHK